MILDPQSGTPWQQQEAKSHSDTELMTHELDRLRRERDGAQAENATLLALLGDWRNEVHLLDSPQAETLLHRTLAALSAKEAQG